jgi:tRNA uridine 5-carboxymethylaminomethyl modification enzyme
LVGGDAGAKVRLKSERVADEWERMRSTTVAATDQVNQRLTQWGSAPLAQAVRAIELLKRPEVPYAELVELAGLEPVLDFDQAAELEIEVKYDGYVKRQAETIERFKRLEDTRIPGAIDYHAVPGLSTEVRERLSAVRPHSLGQAARMPGITPAALSLLAVHIRGGSVAKTMHPDDIESS